MLCLLGEPAVVLDNRLVSHPLRPKALALVAYLALTERPVARREVAQLLFPEAVEPLATLRWHLNHLRATLPAPIASQLQASRDDVALTLPTDVARFRDGVVRVCASPGVRDAAAVLALYRGDLLAGLAVSASADFDDWLYVQREQLQRQFRQATLAFAKWAVAHGHATEAAKPLSHLVSVDPYAEDGHILLIEAYERLGQHRAAATAYDRYQRIVRRELAAEPRPSIARRFEAVPPSGPTLPHEDFVPLRDVTIHVVDWPGEEPAILGIHGSAAMAHTLGALAERLAPGKRFIALDLRGHGFSDKPPHGYDVKDHVTDVLGLMEALDLRRPVLLGHSAGGAIATFAAAQAEIAGLILLDGMVGDRAFAENAAAQAAPLATELGRPIGGFDEYQREWLAQKSYSSEAERLIDRWIRYALAPKPDGTYRRRGLRNAVEAEWASIVESDSLGALSQVACPILIVQAIRPWLVGRPYFTNSIVETQMRAAPSAELFVARLSDHTTMVRDPEPKMIEAILRFVERCGHPVVQQVRRSSG